MKANDHRTSRFHHFDGGLPGLFDEPEVKGQQGFASCGGAEMQCIGKIHTPLRVFESFGEHDRALHREARQSREGARAAATSVRKRPYTLRSTHSLSSRTVVLTKTSPASIAALALAASAQAGNNDTPPRRAHRDDSEQVRSDRYSQFTWPVRQISAHLRSHQHPTPTARSVALHVAAGTEPCKAGPRPVPPSLCAPRLPARPVAWRSQTRHA